MNHFCEFFLLIHIQRQENQKMSLSIFLKMTKSYIYPRVNLLKYIFVAYLWISSSMNLSQTFILWVLFIFIYCIFKRVLKCYCMATSFGFKTQHQQVISLTLPCKSTSILGETSNWNLKTLCCPFFQSLSTWQGWMLFLDTSFSKVSEVGHLGATPLWDAVCTQLFSNFVLSFTMHVLPGK